jgi:hypothetical protein
VEHLRDGREHLRDGVPEHALVQLSPKRKHSLTLSWLRRSLGSTLLQSKARFVRPSTARKYPPTQAACRCAWCDESPPARPGTRQPPVTRANRQQTSASATAPSRAMTLLALSRNEQPHWTSPNLHRCSDRLGPRTPSDNKEGIIFQFNTRLSSSLFDWTHGPLTRAVIPS